MTNESNVRLLYFFQTIDLVGAAAGADIEDGGALRKTLGKLSELSEKADAYQNADVVARHVEGDEKGVSLAEELLFVLICVPHRSAYLMLPCTEEVWSCCEPDGSIRGDARRC